MKIARTIGLVALAAAMLTALAGASTALANPTVLCKSSASDCPEGQSYPSGTAIKASAGKMTIETSLGNIECGASIEGKTTAASGEPLPGEVSAWTLSGCGLEGEGCTATAEHLPYSASIAYGAGGSETIALKGSGGSGGWHFSCGFFINCTLSFNPTLAVHGGNPAQLVVAKEQMGISGALCPSTAKTLETTLTASAPAPLYVREPHVKGAVLCSANESTCLSAHVYPSGSKLEAGLATGTQATIATSLGEISCASSSFSGATSARSGEKAVPASIEAFSLGSCTFLGSESCSAVSENLPYAASFGWETWSPRTSPRMTSPLRLHVSCGFSGFQCTFYTEGATGASFALVNGSPATLQVNQELARTGTRCPATSTFKAKYQVSSPKPLYLVYNE